MVESVDDHPAYYLLRPLPSSGESLSSQEDLEPLPPTLSPYRCINIEIHNVFRTQHLCQFLLLLQFLILNMVSVFLLFMRLLLMPMFHLFKLMMKHNLILMNWLLFARANEVVICTLCIIFCHMLICLYVFMLLSLLLILILFPSFYGGLVPFQVSERL